MESKGRAILQTEPPKNYIQAKSCRACARTVNLKKIYVKRGDWYDELCYCKSCWSQIIEEIWPDYKGKNKDN